MAAPRIILRFRELTPDVDTIDAHLNVISRENKVWWGWWKKESEPDYREELNKLAQDISDQNPISAWLIDTSAERLHLATVIAIKTKLSKADRRYVPHYYQSSIPKIPVWFCIRDIATDQFYDRALESRVGENTLTFLPA